MALSDRIAILISGDASQFIREVDKAGAAAEKNLTKAEGSSKNLSATLTKAGAGMVAFGAVVGAGLLSAAKASEEAHAQVVKLDSTLATQPQLANANRQSFLDLAEAIQQKTAADGDAVLGAEALLGQFGLTQQGILQLTPLVVDLSRKMGIDLESAAKAVGKATDGNAGALKKMGVELDANALKTDGVRAVTEGLRTAVGGFAEEEGKTFSGQLERLKNNLGDVEEGIGAGVVGALNKVIGPLNTVVGKFHELPEGVQESAGSFLALVAGGATVAGGLLVVAGQLDRLRKAFDEGGAAGGRFGSAIKGIAVGSVVAGGFLAAARAVEGFTDDLKSAQQIIDDLATKRGDDLANAFISEAAVSKTKAGLDAIKENFKDVADSNQAQAIRIRDALEKGGAPADLIGQLNSILEQTSAKHKQAAADAKTNAAALDEEGDAAGGANEQFQSQLELLDRLHGKVQDAAGAELSYQQQLLTLKDTQQDYNDKLKDAIDKKGKNAEANGALSVAELDLKQKLLDTAEAAKNKAERTAEAHGATDAAAIGDAAFRTELDRLAGTVNGPLADYLRNLIKQLDDVAKPRESVIHITTTGEVGGIGNIHFRARGGPVTAGETYVVGENEPELFIPSTDGEILPHLPTGRPPGLSSVIAQRTADYVARHSSGQSDAEKQANLDAAGRTVAGNAAANADLQEFFDFYNQQTPEVQAFLTAMGKLPADQARAILAGGGWSGGATGTWGAGNDRPVTFVIQTVIDGKVVAETVKRELLRDETRNGPIFRGR